VLPPPPPPPAGARRPTPRPGLTVATTTGESTRYLQATCKSPATTARQPSSAYPVESDAVSYAARAEKQKAALVKIKTDFAARQQAAAVGPRPRHWNTPNATLKLRDQVIANKARQNAANEAELAVLGSRVADSRPPSPPRGTRGDHGLAPTARPARSQDPPNLSTTFPDNLS